MLQSAVQRAERESLSESGLSGSNASARLFLPAMITAADLHYSPGPLQSASLSPAERASSQLLSLSLSHTSVTLFVVAVVKLIQRRKKLTALVWPTLKATLTIRSKDKIMIALLEYAMSAMTEDYYLI